jgi:hypothetical protein
MPDLSSLRNNLAANYQPIPGASTKPQQSEFLKTFRALNARRLRAEWSALQHRWKQQLRIRAQSKPNPERDTGKRAQTGRHG